MESKEFTELLSNFVVLNVNINKWKRRRVEGIREKREHR